MKLRSICYISLAFCFVLLMSCEKEYDIGEGYNHQKIVVDCVFNSDSMPLVRLSKAASPYFSSPYSNIDSAKIVILGTSDIIDSFEYIGNGLYRSGHIFKPKNHYNLLVNVNDTVVTSRSYLPESITINSVVHEVVVDDNKKLLKSKFSISTAGEKYLILTHVVRKKAFTNNNDTIQFEDDVWVEGEDNFFEQVLPEESPKKILLKKVDSDTLTFTIYSSDGYVKDDNLIEGKSFFNFYSCSEEYYSFVKSKMLYEFNNIGDKTSIISASGVYSNISNGFGIFAGYNKIEVVNEFK